MGKALVGSRGAGSRNGGKSSSERLAEAEQILTDRMNGMQVSALMAKYGYSRGTIVNRINAAVDARISPTVDKYREMEGQYLDGIADDIERMKNAAKEIVMSGINSGDITMIDRGLEAFNRATSQSLRLSERRSKLYGLDSPVKVEAVVATVTQEDLEMQELIREARFRAAAEPAADTARTA